MGLKQRLASWLFLDLWGWRIAGPEPHDIPKCVVVVLPHTSNWDFPVGILYTAARDIEINFAGKDSLFKPPIGGLMRRLGGRPVVRTRRMNFVEAVADIFRREEVFRLCLTPEGTRRRVTDLKTGYYWIAREAGVPIVMCGFDWATKTMHWAPPISADRPYEEVLEAMHDFFRGMEGYYPDRAYPIPPPAQAAGRIRSTEPAR